MFLAIAVASDLQLAGYFNDAHQLRAAFVKLCSKLMPQRATLTAHAVSELKAQADIERTVAVRDEQDDLGASLPATRRDSRMEYRLVALKREPRPADAPAATAAIQAE